MSDLTQEEKETFDVSLCKHETYLSILENLSYYTAHGNTRAINVFNSLKTEMEQKCDMVTIRRALNGHLPRTITKPTPRKFTMNGSDIIEIHSDGTLSLYVPEEEKITIPHQPTEVEEIIRALPSKELVEYVDPFIVGKRVPRICDPNLCEIEMCPSRLDRNQHNKPCRYRIAPNPKSQFDQRLQIPITRSLSDTKEREFTPPSSIKKPEKPKKKEFRESLGSGMM